MHYLDIRKVESSSVQVIVFADTQDRGGAADSVSDDAAVDQIILSSGYSVGIPIRKTDIHNLILALEKAQELWS